MIAIRKLVTLKPQSRLRKIARILAQVERAFPLAYPGNDVLPGENRVDAWHGEVAGRGYLGQLGMITDECEDFPSRVRAAGRALAEFCRSVGDPPDAAADPAGPYGVLRAVNGFRHAILAYLGEEAAEWDLLPPAWTSQAGAAASFRFPITVYLDDIRSPFNVGSIVRTAAAFGIEGVVLSTDCAAADHPRARRSAMGADRLISVRRGRLDEVAGAAPHLIALEQGGTPLPRFSFPACGVVVVGSEELGVSPSALAAADRRDGRVTIPLCGLKASVNVGVAFGILLSAWTGSLAAAATGKNACRSGPVGHREP